ncbi:ribosomal protein L37AE/L43A [Paenibacillus aceris]|uniref:Ribosomal protein L37AE/L43A n=1 Tax=Paenibacillus aceris TaxID=869555 RepID=A0ABS4HU44_9BACL|nr:ribosomal protein L37AE/L43A [Paenibacillus aceris]
MITCEQCGKTNGFRKPANNWICEDCKIGDVKTTLTNKGGTVTIVRERIIGYEAQGDGSARENEG